MLPCSTTRPIEVRFRQELDLKFRLKIEAVHGLEPAAALCSLKALFPLLPALGRFSWDENVDMNEIAGCCWPSNDMDLCRQ